MSKNSSIGLFILVSSVLHKGKKFVQGVKQALKASTISGNYTLAFILKFLAESSKPKTETANIHQGNTNNIEKHFLKQLPTIHANCSQFIVPIDAFHSSCKNPLSAQ